MLILNLNNSKLILYIIDTLYYTIVAATASTATATMN